MGIALHLKKYFVSTVILSLFIIVFVMSSKAQYTVACEAGGPYTRNATINVVGNVTNNSAGTVANVSVNLSVGSTQRASANTTSDSEGRFHPSFFLNLDLDTYTVVVAATRNGNTSYCTDTINVAIGLNTSCKNRIIRVSGVAVYSSNANIVNTGNATVGILEEKVAATAPMNSTGGFTASIATCLLKGSRYTLNVIIHNGNDKRGFLQQTFVAP